MAVNRTWVPEGHRGPLDLRQRGEACTLPRRPQLDRHPRRGTALPPSTHRALMIHVPIASK
jgi:hypothetical protein